MNSEMSASENCQAWWATSPLPGAIGILHLHGNVSPVLRELGLPVPEVGTSLLAQFRDIDEGIITRPKEQSVILMPHGGPRIRQLLSEAVSDAGAEFVVARDIDPCHAWPEARSLVEACMLSTLSFVESTRAIDLLLAQPEIHARCEAQGWTPSSTDDARADELLNLIHPPLIAIVGSPNVGKSTLLNQIADREVAITAEVAGTTRDAVSARVDIDGIACDIIDLPGERTSSDPIEAKAIEMSQVFLREADFVLAVIEPSQPQHPPLSREPDMIVCNKSDLGSAPAHIEVCAREKRGISTLVQMIRQRLVPDDALNNHDKPWLFHQALRCDQP